MLGFIGIMLTAWLAPNVFKASIAPEGLSVMDARLFAVMMAVAEETFFRGFLMSWFMRQFSNIPLAIMLQALVFGIYHMAVYGSTPTLMLYVIIAGGILGFIAWRTNRLSTSILTHAAINFLAVG